MDLMMGGGSLRKYANYTRVIAVLDVILATLGFFFNPFNDEVTDVPFLYWKITITCFVFEIWMIVSIHLFVATQKSETRENPAKSIKYCNYWLVVATLAFIVFEAIIVFPPNLEPTSLWQMYWPSGILLYRILATLIVLKYKDKLNSYSFTVVPGDLTLDQQKLDEAFPDLLHCTASSLDFQRSLCRCAGTMTTNGNSSAPVKSCGIGYPESSRRPEINFYLNPNPAVNNDARLLTSPTISTTAPPLVLPSSGAMDLLRLQSSKSENFQNDLIRGVNV